MDTKGMSGRKGQAVEQLPGGFVSIVFLLVIAMIVLGVLAAFPGISDWFKNAFTIPEATMKDYLIAKQSTDALVCAVNSVALGEEWGNCWGTFKSSGGGLALAGLAVAKGTTVEDGSVKNGATIECSKTLENVKKVGEITAKDVMEAGAKCKGQFGEEAFYISTGNKAGDGNTIYECRIAPMTCTVKNFQMPQDIAKGENWVPFYGDPKFLMYWNMFPLDEDTWTFEADWRIHFFIGAVSILPIGKVASIGTMLGFRYVTRQAVKSALKNYLVDFAKKRFTKWGVAKIIAKWAALGIGVAGMSELDKASAAITESMLKKYEPQPNSIVLKVPSALSENDLVPFDLVSKLEEKPVLVKWRPEVLTETKNLHLVSPCYLNEFEVKKTIFVCNKYSYNKETGVIICDGAEESDKRLVRCGVLDKSLDDYMGTPFYDTLTEVIKVDDMTLYSDTKGTELWEHPDKLYLPWHSREGEILYLDDFEPDVNAARNEYPSRLQPGQIKDSANAFNAILYKNGKKAFGLVPVYNEDNKIMESGKAYVLHIYFIDEPWASIENDVIVDIYPVDMCETSADQIVERHEISRKSLSCDQVKKVTETVSSIDEIKALVAKADEETEFIMKFTPAPGAVPVTPKDLLSTEGFNFKFGADHLWTEREGSFAGETAKPSYEGCYKDTKTVDGVRVSYTGRRQCFRILDQPVKVGLTVHKMLLVGADIDERLLRIESVDEQFKSIFLPDCTRFKAESPDGKSINIEEDEPATDCKFSIQNVYIDDKNKYTAVFTDDTNDGKWDTIRISPIADWKEAFGLKDAKEITLSEINSNGEPQHIGMRNCYTDGVMIDLTGLDSKKVDVGGKNYCLRHKSAVLVAIKWGGRAVGAAGIVFAGVFSGGSAWAFMAIAAVPALAEVTTESITEYKGLWP